MRNGLAIVIMFAAIGSLLAPSLQAQEDQAPEGIGERIGEQLDRGLDRLRTELQDELADIRKTVERLSVHGRVYSRIRWDKALESSSIDIEVTDSDVVVLKGSVPTAQAKQKATQLARDTVGVTSVIDELTVKSAPRAERRSQ